MHTDQVHMLHEATKLGDLEVMQGMITITPSLLHSSSKGWSLLMESARQGHVHIATYLLQQGVDKNQMTMDAFEFTAFYIACAYGKGTMVSFLLHHGCNPYLKKEGTWSSLMAAAYKGHVEIVKALLDHHRQTTTTSSSSSAHFLDWQDEDGQTALSLAIAAGQKNVVELLLWAGANPSLADHQGQTPLDLAQSKGDADIIHLIKVGRKTHSPPTPSSRLSSHISSSLSFYPYRRPWLNHND